MNAMAQAMQLRGLQESSQMNALRMQEYQRGLENRNKLARIYADPKLIAGSPEQLARIQQEVPDEYQSAAERALKDADLREKIAARKLSETKTQLDIDNQKVVQLKEAQREVTNFESVKDAIDHVNRKLAAGLIDKKHADYMLAQLPKNPLDFGKWKENTLMSMLTAEQQFTGRQKLRDEQYSEYVYDATDKGEIPMSKADYFASINKQPAAAPAPDTTNTTTPADASMVMPTQAATTVAANGDRVLPTVEKVEGVFGLHPQAVAFYRAGNKEMGDKVQAAHVEKKRSEQLTGDFQNVMRAEEILAELKKKKNPTPLDLAQIKTLQKQIDVANESKAPRISQRVEVSTEKKFGEKFAGNIADKDVALLDAAERAPEAANTANRVLSLLASGQVITGAGANIKLQLAKWLRVAGGSENETIANTEILLSSLADTTLGSIKSSNLGSGQGFTNSDRDFLERAKAGQITYDAASLRRLAELSHRAAEATTDKWNKRSKAIPKSAIEGTGISTEDIKVSPLYKSGGSNKTPLKNAQGWVLSEDKKGNKAYVSPDGKQFEEVK
jgi:hypothetical protein